MKFLDYEALKRLVEKIKTKYLPLSGGTITGMLTCNGAISGKGGLELYGNPYGFIDFHYSNSTADYTSRIIESTNGTLDINNIKFNKTQGLIVPTNYHAKYESWLVESYVNDSGTGALCSFQIYSENGAWSIRKNTANNVDSGTGGDYNFIQCNCNGNLTLGNQRTTINYSDGSITTPKVTQTSDKRLKENINCITEDLDKIKEVEFVEFNLTDDVNKTKYYGVIAQDLEAAGLNNLVVENVGGIKAVDYTALIILELQRLRTEIQDLKTKSNGNN